MRCIALCLSVIMRSSIRCVVTNVIFLNNSIYRAVILLCFQIDNERETLFHVVLPLP